MNIKRLITWILGFFAGVIVLTILWFVFFGPKQPTPTPGVQQPVTLPGSATVPISSTTPQGANTMTVAASGSGSITTNDFIHNGTTIPDAVNKGRYLLAGDLGYCILKPTDCKAGSETDFNILYDNVRQSFTIALLSEPIGQARIKMEQFMMQILGIRQADMCKLKYYVGTTSDVNPLYDSKNLGFSFCPGATQLPQ